MQPTPPVSEPGISSMPLPMTHPRSMELLQPAKAVSDNKEATAPMAPMDSQPVSMRLQIDLPPVMNDNVDDWGEMVSSPSVTQNSTSSFSNNIYHAKSTEGRSEASNDTLNFPLAGIAESTSSSAGPDRPESNVYQNILPSSKASQFSESAFTEVQESPISSTPATSYLDDLNNPKPPATSSIADPWASVDFSFFETPSATVSKHSTSSQPPMPSPARSVMSKKPPTSARPLVPTRSKEQVEQDKVVEGIVKSLPDLSYMLRR